MTPNDFLKIIQDSIYKRYEPVPKGWYSIVELCKIWNLNSSHASRKVRMGIELGIVEKKDYFLQKSNGVRKVPHYFFHDEKKRKSKN
jgi:hypothetical protein